MTKISLFLITGFYLITINLFSSETLPRIDLSHVPDYRQLTSLADTGNLSLFRDSLADALTATWRPAQTGRSSSSSQDSFARWVDLYQWSNLLASEESEILKKWLSHHLQATDAEAMEGKPLHVTIFDPGTALSHDSVSPEILEKLMTDSPLMEQVIQRLIAQPFTPENGLLSTRLEAEFITTTISDPDFLKKWAAGFSEDDFAPKVLLNLQSIWQENRTDWHEFLSLALAIALVKDQPAPSFWPHHQVAANAVPKSEVEPPILFSEWVQAFRKGKLRMDPRLLEVGELKFVIDAPIDSSELDWVRNNPILAHQDPPKAFDSIGYDHKRLSKNILDWPWGSYQLSAIKEHGGICVDQAYYAAISGKALGIPTIYFSGQGKDGGHAWIGYLKGPGQWDFNVARYADQKFATGESLDPQNWTQINDHDLELLTRHLGSHELQDAARRDLVIAAIFRKKGDLEGEGRALQSALTTSPENPAIWDAKEAWLLRSMASVATLKAHHEAAIAQFSRFSDLKIQHQQALVKLALNSGEQKNAEELSRSMVNQNRMGGAQPARTDLSAAAAWALISEHLKVDDIAGSLEEFEHQLRLQGANGGGDFLYKVISPLASALISSGHQDLAQRILKESSITLKPIKDSLVDRNIKSLWKEAGGSP
jgi:hypothetical protein